MFRANGNATSLGRAQYFRAKKYRSFDLRTARDSSFYSSCIYSSIRTCTRQVNTAKWSVAKCSRNVTKLSGCVTSPTSTFLLLYVSFYLFFFLIFLSISVSFSIPPPSRSGKKFVIDKHKYARSFATVVRGILSSACPTLLLIAGCPWRVLLM